MTMTCYGIVALGSDRKPVKYLPFDGEGWAPGTAFKLQSDPAIAWRFGNKQTAQETAGDLIVGAESKSAIGTLVERTTRFLMP